MLKTSNNTIKADFREKRIAWVDLMESLAIYFVILYHTTLYSFDFLVDGGMQEYLRYFMRMILSACVPVFFFVNGFLLFRKTFNLKEHIKRLVRVIVLAEIWGMLTLLILMFVKQQYLSLSTFLEYLWNWQGEWINHLWYLGALACVYVFFPLLKVAFDNSKKTFVYFTAVCAIFTFGNNLLNIAGTVFGFFLKLDVTFTGYNFFNMFNPLRGIPGYALTYFCLGGVVLVLYEKIVSVSPRRRNIFAVTGLVLSNACLFAAGIIYSKASGAVYDMVWNGYDTVFTLINVFCLFLLCLNFNSTNKLFVGISTNTLGIYLIHEFFWHGTKTVIKSFEFLRNLMFNMVYAAALLLLCLALCILLKKIPIIQKLFKL